MKEYIKREAVRKEIDKYRPGRLYEDAWALTIVDSIPAADVVEVVRCKDCRYSRKPNRHDRDENAACEGVLICCVGFDHIYPSAYDGLIFTDENDYCSHGEREDGADD